jgi:hypothetical protein
MSNYECQQCKQTSDLPFSGGKCSKCGSLNIKKLNKPKRKAQKDESSKKSLLVILLWGYIIYELWKRLYS